MLVNNLHTSVCKMVWHVLHVKVDVAVALAAAAAAAMYGH
jgi:hypothetical protein